MAVDHREYDFFLLHDCVVIVQWFAMLGPGGAIKKHPPEWKSIILPTLEKLAGGAVPPEAPGALEEKERVETLHVQAAGYRPADFKVTLPAGSNGWNVTGAITDGRAGIANAALRWEGGSTITKSDSQGRYNTPFGKVGANPTVVRLDVRLDKSPPIKLDVTEGGVLHPFLPFPMQGPERKVQLVFTAEGINKPADHRGKIKFLNARQLPFVAVEARDGNLDAAGKWSVTATVRKLEPSETFSLADLPMAAEFEASIEPPKWHTPIARAKFTVPLGAFIMMGSTIGPDYRKRYTPLAPEAITALHLAYPERVKSGLIRNVHLLGQVNAQGDFWTMIRAPERGDSNDILLQWSDLCKTPLLLRACGRVGYKPEMTGKKHLLIFERAAGKIDLLSPEEHESRIRELTIDFLNQMPLKKGPRGDLIALVKGVQFSYDKTASRPCWNGNAIVLPGDKRKLWGEEPYGRLARGNRAIYVLAFHEMGHALHEFAVEKLGRIAWVRKLTYGAAAHSTWEPPTVSMPMPTMAAPGLSWKVRRKAVAFIEATAEFFAWCMYEHLEQTKADTFGKSVYFERDYLAQFDTDDKALAACHHGGFQVEGVQVAFLRALYTGLPASLAFGDFLRTMALYQDEHFFLRWVPARAIDEWVAMKIKHGGPGGDVKALAGRFNIIGGPAIFLQLIQDGTVYINDKPAAMGSDKNQFVRLDIGDTVRVESGSFLVNFTSTSSKQGVLDHIRLGFMAAKKGCEFEVVGPFDVRLFKGQFAAGGVDTDMPAGKVKHTQTSYVVELDDAGAAVVAVVDGAIQIETPHGITAVSQGQAVGVDLAGKVRPAPARDTNELAAEFEPAPEDETGPPGAPAEKTAWRLDLKTLIVQPGERIVVVHNACLIEDQYAWIGLYKKADDRDEDYLAYTFLRNLTDRTYDINAPDEPGDEYHFRLFKTKGYECTTRSSMVEVQ